MYKSVLIEKSADDEEKVEEILQFIGKSGISPVYTSRLKSKVLNKPGPILIELSEASLIKPVLLAVKKMRLTDEHKLVYISSDLTDKKRELDYKLRKARNILNSLAISTWHQWKSINQRIIFINGKIFLSRLNVCI